MPRKVDHADFRNRARKVHGNKFEYVGKYTAVRDKIKIRCATHGIFSQHAGSHLKGIGCPSCAGVKKKTHADFVIEASALHKGKYEYVSKYVLSHLKIKIKCPEHGVFEQIASNHLKGQGCVKCLGLVTDHKEFVAKARSVHGDKYKYPETYKGNAVRIKIVCPAHGAFTQSPLNHNNGSGCSICHKVGYSAAGVAAVKKVAASFRLRNVQHALNGGEFVIPGTRYRADGYHEKTRTVIEFMGDAFHGNPRVYEPRARCHPFTGQRAKHLYRATRNRIRALRSLGYRVLVVWQSDYKALDESESIRSIVKIYERHGNTK